MGQRAPAPARPTAQADRDRPAELANCVTVQRPGTTRRPEHIWRADRVPHGRPPQRQVRLLLHWIAGRRKEYCREGDQIVRHVTILDELVLACRIPRD